MGTIRLIFADREGLRLHLDNLNEDGKQPTAVGLDSTPRPFLITLVGPYAEGEEVLFDSPWQSDVGYGDLVDGKWVPKKPRCAECNGIVHEIEDLRYPVTVLAIAP